MRNALLPVTLFVVAVAATTVVALQCPTGLPGGSKYLICLSGSGTPAAKPQPYPIQLGEPGLQFLTSKAGIHGTDNIRLFR